MAGIEGQDMATVTVNTMWTLAASGPATYTVTFAGKVSAYAHRPIHCRWLSAATGSPPAESNLGEQMLLVNRPTLVPATAQVTGAGNGLWLKGYQTRFMADVV